MIAKQKTEDALTPAQLVAALDSLGVLFLRGASSLAVAVEPHVLLTALAASNEARLRLALIPLLLAHPEFSVHAVAALQQSPPDAAITLRCYYAAAYWLQTQYRARITAYLGAIHSLPDLFSAELNLPESTDPDAALHALTLRQRELTDLALNRRVRILGGSALCLLGSERPTLDIRYNAQDMGLWRRNHDAASGVVQSVARRSESA